MKQQKAGDRKERTKYAGFLCSLKALVVTFYAGTQKHDAEHPTAPEASGATPRAKQGSHRPFGN